MVMEGRALASFGASTAQVHALLKAHGYTNVTKSYLICGDDNAYLVKNR